MSESAQSLLLMSVGPVQDFISTARRSQDLWYGSRLLSDLARTAAECVRAEAEGDDVLVFPGALAEGAVGATLGDVANKVVALLSGDVQTARGVAAKAEEAVRQRLRDEGTRMLKRVARGLAPDERRHYLLEERAREQIDEMLELSWVTVAVTGGRYGEARQEAERWLSARKNVRDWKQPSWGDTVPKCSLDGVRESVLHESVFERREQSEPEHAAWLYQNFRVQSGERLSGPSLLKRWGTVEDDDGEVAQNRVASTTHMAALPWMIGAGHKPVDIEAYLSLLRAELGAPFVRSELEVTPQERGAWGRMDGACLFPGRIDALVEEAGLGKDVAVKVKKGLASLLKSVQSAPSEPLPYYAIVLADGDRMGVAIGAEDNADAHRKLSAALSGFAQSVEKLAEKHSASVIYTGGDDVLALAPLHSVLDFADELRLSFWEAMRAAKERPTLSVGVAICHHLLPLSVALEHVRTAERLAKKERNSLGIVLDKRSGPTTELWGQWSENRAGNLAQRLKRIADWHRRGVIPMRMGHELSKLAELERGLSGEDSQKFRGVIQAEVLRMLDRKQIAGRPGTNDAGDDDTFSRVDELVRATASGGASRLGDELVAARLIADALEQSGATPLGEPAAKETV